MLSGGSSLPRPPGGLVSSPGPASSPKVRRSDAFSSFGNYTDFGELLKKSLTNPRRSPILSRQGFKTMRPEKRHGAPGLLLPATRPAPGPSARRRTHNPLVY